MNNANFMILCFCCYLFHKTFNSSQLQTHRARHVFLIECVYHVAVFFLHNGSLRFLFFMFCYFYNIRGRGALEPGLPLRSSQTRKKQKTAKAECCNCCIFHSFVFCVTSPPQQNKQIKHTTTVCVCS